MTSRGRIPLWRRPLPRRTRTAFIGGDASGSVFTDVSTTADDFIRGDATGAVVQDVSHAPRRGRSVAPPR